MAPKRGGGCIFESCDISLENMPMQSHTVSPALVICTCSDFAMPLLSCACLRNNSKSCLPSFVSSFPCTALLLLCFLLNITACTVARMGGCTFERKAPFATILLKKGGGRIFECGLIFGDYGNKITYKPVSMVMARLLAAECMHNDL